MMDKLYFLILIILVMGFFAFIIEFFKRKKCVLCGGEGLGIYYEFSDIDLFNSGLFNEKYIYFFKNKQGLDNGEKCKTCYDCKIEIKKNLVDNNKEEIPKKVGQYFGSDKNLLFFKIKKTEIKPGLLIIFFCFAYIGLYMNKDVNSLYSIIGIEGLIIYPVSWILYHNVYWHGYIGRKGIVIFQKYPLLNLFYQEYNWDRVKGYSLKKHEMKLHINEIDIFSTIFSFKFFIPLDKKKKKKLNDILDKNNIPVK